MQHLRKTVPGSCRSTDEPAFDKPARPATNSRTISFRSASRSSFWRCADVGYYHCTSAGLLQLEGTLRSLPVSVHITIQDRESLNQEMPCLSEFRPLHDLHIVYPFFSEADMPATATPEGLCHLFGTTSSSHSRDQDGWQRLQDKGERVEELTPVSALSVSCKHRSFCTRCWYHLQCLDTFYMKSSMSSRESLMRCKLRCVR